MKYLILCLLFFIAGTQAKEPTENNQQSVESTSKQAEELLAEVSQPAEDATNIKVIVMTNQTIEEYRQKGELVLVKVIPNEGKPYYIDPMERDKNKESGRELINSGVKPVRWVLKEF